MLTPPGDHLAEMLDPEPPRRLRPQPRRNPVRELQPVVNPDPEAQRVLQEVRAELVQQRAAREAETPPAQPPRRPPRRRMQRDDYMPAGEIKLRRGL